jgi:hypothetical protein
MPGQETRRMVRGLREMWRIMPMIRVALLVCAAILADAPIAQSIPSTALPRGEASGLPARPSTYPLTQADLLVLRQALRPKDERTPRQRCLDKERRMLGGHVSDLAAAAIDLKCSQL